jgi:hypothetical protein
MALNKSLRVERMASAGIMLTEEEIAGVVDKRSNGKDPKASIEVLRDIALVARTIGREVCGADCQLECAAIDLTETISKYDADLTARCAVSDCSNEGILAAQESIAVSITD